MPLDTDPRLAPGSSETVEIAVMPPTAASVMLEIQDAESVRRVPLKETPVVLGTSRATDVVIMDATVSSRHCVLAAKGGGVSVKDLGSRNGTYVGGARIQEAWGCIGMTILLGRTTVVCLGADVEEEEPLGEPLPGVAGRSIAMCRVAMQVRRLARLSAPVLITGETGVGKELIAKALHVEGTRAECPFVALNVAALPRELVESELFGHERGAFTGAVSRRAGAFAEAAGGTLFLDEIGELPLDAQPKLLRALDGYEVRRVGGAGSGERADARVVAATHAPLLDLVRARRFRRDLFHRLEVFVVELPPLRTRPGDILPVARMLLAQMAEELGGRELTTGAVAQLTAYDWPGNVRELRNVLARAADLSKRHFWIDTDAVVRAIRRARLSDADGASKAPLNPTPEAAKHWLVRHGGNVSAAARAARIPRTTFRKLLK
jgi:DNA-binding NtrC family response regulator